MSGPFDPPGTGGPAYSARFDEAVAFAMDEFRTTYRKASPVPYITHLLAVTALVGEHGGDEDQMIAAVLHDWLEDIPGATPHRVRQRWGERVERMVVACSDAIDEHPKRPWRERKEAYLAHVRGEPNEVKLITACDKLHNARSIVRDLRRVGVSAFDRFNAGMDGTLWYYREVFRALSEGFDHPVLSELDDAITEMEALSGRR